MLKIATFSLKLRVFAEVGTANLVWSFDGHVLDLDRRELRRAGALIKVEPQVFDLLVYLVRHRDRVVSQEELLQVVWRGRIVSDSALTTRINAARRAINDNGKAQRLIRTLRRKGIRFVGEVGEMANMATTAVSQPPAGAQVRLFTAASVGRPSIAVLPFVALGSQLDERRLAIGLVEDIVVALSRFRWLSVVGPMSPGVKVIDAKRIGAELGVRYVVHGMVRRSNQRLRITAHLIDAMTGSHLWAERFDGQLADHFALQDKVSAVIAGSVEPVVQIVEANRYNAFPNRAATPYDLHLQAQPIFSSGKESVLRSLNLLERAIALDPTYGPALADGAFCLQVLDINGWARDRLANRRKAVDFARRALQVSCDPEPVATAAFACAYFGEDIDAALSLVNDSLALNPSFARGWYMSGMSWLYAGRPEQAIESFETSIRLNPRDRLGRRNIAGIGIAHFFNGRFDQAVSRLRVVVQEFPRWATPIAALVSCHAHLGFLGEAEAVAGQMRVADPLLAPTANQFRHAKHRELFMPGMKIAAATQRI